MAMVRVSESSSISMMRSSWRGMMTLEPSAVSTSMQGLDGMSMNAVMVPMTAPSSSSQRVGPLTAIVSPRRPTSHLLYLLCHTRKVACRRS